MIDLIQLRKEAESALEWDEHRDVCVPAKDVLALLDVVEAAKSITHRSEKLHQAFLRLEGKGIKR